MQLFLDNVLAQSLLTNEVSFAYVVFSMELAGPVRTWL